MEEDQERDGEKSENREEEGSGAEEENDDDEEEDDDEKEEEDEEGSSEEEDGHSDLDSDQESENEERNQEDEETGSTKPKKVLSTEELKAQQEAAKAELPYTFTGEHAAVFRGSEKFFFGFISNVQCFYLQVSLVRCALSVFV